MINFWLDEGTPVTFSASFMTSDNKDDAGKLALNLLVPEKSTNIVNKRILTP